MRRLRLKTHLNSNNLLTQKEETKQTTRMKQFLKNYAKFNSCKHLKLKYKMKEMMLKLQNKTKWNMYITKIVFTSNLQSSKNINKKTINNFKKSQINRMTNHIKKEMCSQKQQKELFLLEKSQPQKQLRHQIYRQNLSIVRELRFTESFPKTLLLSLLLIGYSLNQSHIHHQIS